MSIKEIKFIVEFLMKKTPEMNGFTGEIQFFKKGRYISNFIQY